ncbi:hypothetical protein C8F01DRAFT_1362368 [Mycena amicta]|nr:hypothetical protein C8F01DRAFT_1362368 [Mycena amicta]
MTEDVCGKLWTPKLETKVCLERSSPSPSNARVPLPYGPLEPRTLPALVQRTLVPSSRTFSLSCRSSPTVQPHTEHLRRMHEARFLIAIEVVALIDDEAGYWSDGWKSANIYEGAQTVCPPRHPARLERLQNHRPEHASPSPSPSTTSSRPACHALRQTGPPPADDEEKSSSIVPMATSARVDEKCASATRASGKTPGLNFP